MREGKENIEGRIQNTEGRRKKEEEELEVGNKPSIAHWLLAFGQIT